VPADVTVSDYSSFVITAPVLSIFGRALPTTFLGHQPTCGGNPAGWDGRLEVVQAVETPTKTPNFLPIDIHFQSLGLSLVRGRACSTTGTWQADQLLPVKRQNMTLMRPASVPRLPETGLRHATRDSVSRWPTAVR
jgi:hypothetical protein